MEKKICGEKAKREFLNATQAREKLRGIKIFSGADVTEMIQEQIMGHIEEAIYRGKCKCSVHLCSMISDIIETQPCYLTVADEDNIYTDIICWLNKDLGYHVVLPVENRKVYSVLISW